MHIDHPFIKKYAPIELPPHTRMVGMEEPVALTDCAARIRRSLAEPIDSPPLVQIARQKLQQRLDADGEAANAVIVVSDKTRPVPYKGEQGILLPIVEELLSCGYRSDHILVLIATGTHLPMSETEIWRMIDPRIKDLGIRVVNHDCKDDEHLTFLGKNHTWYGHVPQFTLCGSRSQDRHRFGGKSLHGRSEWWQEGHLSRYHR